MREHILTRRVRAVCFLWFVLASGSLMLACQNDKRKVSRLPGPVATQKRAKSPVARSADLLTRLKASRKMRVSEYRPPNAQEGATFRQWFEHHYQAAVGGRLPTLAPPEHFVALFSAGGKLWHLREVAGAGRGSGAYVLRAGATTEVIVEVPHSFFDRGTLSLGLSLFDALDARALLVNTVHRGGIVARPERLALARSGKSPSDVAHASHSYFQLAHEQLVDSLPVSTVVQLHGFADEKVPGAKIIVSASGTGGSPMGIVRSLNDALPGAQAKAYPDEVRQLGGMKNRQAKASKLAGVSFFHIELAASLRKKLVRDSKARERFAHALGRGISTP